MNCPSLNEIAAFEADASGPGAADTASHVRDCADCRRRVRVLRRQRAAIVDLLASRPPERQPGCPDWESLAAYVERGQDTTGAWVADHVERCESCLLRVATFRMADESAGRELPVLSSAFPARDEKSAWLGGFGNRWWGLGFAAGALAAAGILAIIVSRPPKLVTVALSRPPLDFPEPKFNTPHALPQPAGPPTRPNPAALPAEIGSPQVKPERQLRPEEPTLYRELPRASAPVSVVFRYSSGNASRETPLPLPEALALHSGDHFSIRVETKSSMWLYVFQEDSHNAVSALFPSVRFRTGVNPVVLSDGRVIPAPGREFALDEATGVERIYMFYGPAPIDRCERLLSLVESHSVDSDVRRILRELVRTADASDISAIGYAAIRFSFRHEP
jgi:hypothetical protein